jgi:hypothetical protein
MPSSSDRPKRSAKGKNVAEPTVTIYTDEWEEARDHAARLRPSRGGTVWRRLLDHQERGWEYVRPLALAVEEVERAKEAGKEVDPEHAMYRFTHLEVVDLYRYNAFRCAAMVLAPYGIDLPSTEEIDGDVENFCRFMEMLRLASVHPDAPPEFRVVQDNAPALAEWYADFTGVFEPAVEAYHRRLKKLGYRM